MKHVVYFFKLYRLAGTYAHDLEIRHVLPTNDDRAVWYNSTNQGHLFVAVMMKSRNLQFTATNREIGVLPRQIAKLTILRDKSRLNHFPATDREISSPIELKFRSLDVFQSNLTKRYKI